MRRQTGADRVVLCRPFLDLPRRRLVASLNEANVGWIDDPSNEDDRYARVRLRALMPRLAGEGLTVERLAATTRNLARAADAVDGIVSNLIADQAEIYAFGPASLRCAGLLAAHEEIALRAIARLIQHVGRDHYAPPLAKLESLLANFRNAPQTRFKRTLGGRDCRAEAALDCGSTGNRGAAGWPTLLSWTASAVWDGTVSVTADHHR